MIFAPSSGVKTPELPGMAVILALSWSKSKPAVVQEKRLACHRIIGHRVHRLRIVPSVEPDGHDIRRQKTSPHEPISSAPARSQTTPGEIETTVNPSGCNSLLRRMRAMSRAPLVVAYGHWPCNFNSRMHEGTPLPEVIAKIFFIPPFRRRGSMRDMNCTFPTKISN